MLGLHLRSFVTTTKPQHSLIHNLKSVPWVLTGNSARRRIRLARGEAFFNVAPNKERPFSVYAAGGVVTAVGTAFAVKLAEGKRLDVLVTEGVVALTAQTPESGSALVDQPVQSAVARPQLKVSAGQHAVFEDDVGHVKQANIAGLERKLMWRSGMLAYDGEPLSEVVADVSRYAPVNIEIEDEALKRVPVAGFFRVGEVDMMLEGLSAIADIEVTHVSPREIRLSKKNKG
ncbi:MAG: FecR domain-containing protein [Sphingobium sp.]